MLFHHVETEYLMYIDIAIIVSLSDKVIKIVILLQVEITKIVINVGKDILLSSLHILNLLGKLGLKLWVHIDEFVEHVVGLQLFQIDVENIFSLVGDESNDFILKERDLIEPLSDKISSGVRWCTNQDLRYLRGIFHPVGNNRCDHECFSAARGSLNQREALLQGHNNCLSLRCREFRQSLYLNFRR